ncbi:MAG: GNAT family N-acetyltransferase [bacterium]|nr:GNAT family N-acetyltransferase [bacterium]
MRYELHRLEPGLRDDFFRLHSHKNDHDWCFCVAWHVASFEGWGERSAEENRACRERLIDDGNSDGYLLYDSRREPVAWCQCAPVTDLDHLMRRWNLNPDPAHFAVGCLFVAPDRRGEGVARALLGAVLSDLRLRGAKRVSAIPRRGRDLPPGEAWTGPEALFKAFGFRPRREEGALSLVELSL